jgi:hypothetical protein
MAGFYNPYMSLGGEGKPMPTGNLNQYLNNPNYSGAYKQSPQQAGQAGQGKTFLGMNKDQAIGTGISAIGGIDDAFGKQTSDPMDFSIDPMAGFTGSAKGFASGGPWGAIIGGAVAQLETFNKVHANLKKLDDSVNTVQRDAAGRPMYSGVDVTNAQRNIGALRKGLKATHTGLSGSTHVISWVRGTGKALRRKQKRLTQSIQAGQQDFNNQAQAANSQDLAMDQYRQITNKNNRFRSLYNIGNQSLY